MLLINGKALRDGFPSGLGFNESPENTCKAIFYQHCSVSFHPLLSSDGVHGYEQVCEVQFLDSAAVDENKEV
jgi:hypothetical protein